MARHCRRDKPLRWHIDYLRSVSEPVGVWFSHDDAPLEHRWAEHLANHPLSDLPDFGCSDCHCASHLFMAPRRRDLDTVLATLPGNPVYDSAFVREHRAR